MKRSMVAFLAVSWLLGAVAPLLAHHSFAAEFARDKPITLRGYVTKVEWTNPHVWFYINVKDEKTGRTTNWGFEMGPPHGLQGGDLDVENLPGSGQMRHVVSSLPSVLGAFNQKVWSGLRFVTLTERRIRSNVFPCARVVEPRCSVPFRVHWLGLSAGIGEAPRPDRLRWVQCRKVPRPRQCSARHARG